MHDEPEASEEEQEHAPDRLEDEHAMRSQGHDDPEQFRDGDGDE